MSSGLAIAVYALLLVPAAILVWRRPLFALYAWIVGLAAHNAVMAALYGENHPYGRPVKGTIRSVEGITRDELLRLHAARFSPTDLMVIVVGDVDR